MSDQEHRVTDRNSFSSCVYFMICPKSGMQAHISKLETSSSQFYATNVKS